MKLHLQSFPRPRLSSHPGFVLLAPRVSRGPGRAVSKGKEICEVKQNDREGSARARAQSGPQESQMSEQRDTRGPGTGSPDWRAGGRGGCRSAGTRPGTRRPKNSHFSAFQEVGPGTRGRGQRAAGSRVRASAAAPCGVSVRGSPALAPAKPRSPRTFPWGGPGTAGLHLLQEALPLGGLAQEPPVVVGVGCGVLFLLLLVLRRPAPAARPRVSGATRQRRHATAPPRSPS